MNREVLLRKRDVMETLGCSACTVYKRINEGLLTPPVKTGARSSRWPLSEINQIAAARVRGCGDDIVRAVVAQLIAARKGV